MSTVTAAQRGGGISIPRDSENLTGQILQCCGSERDPATFGNVYLCNSLSNSWIKTTIHNFLLLLRILTLKCIF